MTMGTNDYPFNRLYQYIKNDPLYRDDRCEWFVQSGAASIDEKPACGTVSTLIPRADMETLVQNSALVISHCGIGSLNLMLKYRKRTIFVPRVSQHGEFSDDHQLQIAQEINNQRMDVILPEQSFPNLDYQALCDEPVAATAVDITNYHLARIIEYKLTG
ncbi:MAG: glycosyltransferase [Pseudomonadota bacterium]